MHFLTSPGSQGDIVFIQLRHPADAAGKWDHAIQLCLDCISFRNDFVNLPQEHQECLDDESMMQL
eukprot:2589937-Amphidinium_carterae.1